MSNETLKVVIPMAGYGSRLRPITWSRPKPLINIAGKTVLAHVLDTLKTLPDPDNVELIFIVGYLGDQFEPYMREHYPNRKVHYVVQPEMRGQSHAIALAREHLGGPMLMVFADTLIQADLGLLRDERIEGVAWVKPVPDPRRFGVAAVGEDGFVTRLIEKPTSMENNLVMVGFYYFKDSLALLSAIDEQIKRGVQLKGEYFLADAVNIMLERGMRMIPQTVDVWLDAGIPATVLETNRYLLEHGLENSNQAARPGVAIIPPVYIHPDAQVSGSVIGPHVSISAGCKIEDSILRDTIVEDGAQISKAHLQASLVGQRAVVQGRPASLVTGDQSVLEV